MVVRFGMRAAFAVLVVALAAARAPAACSSKRCPDQPTLRAVRAAVALACDCAGSSRHRQYAKCAKQTIKQAVKGNRLPKACKATAMACESQTTCGRAGAIVCCRLERNGAVAARVMKKAKRCRGTPCTGRPSAADACTEQATCRPGLEGPVSLADVTSVLMTWRARLLPSLPAAERQRVEQDVAAVPLDAPAGTQPIEVVVSQDRSQLTPVVNRRDWAWARHGVGYTVLGGFGQGQGALLDVGLWCFLEAALLRTDEPEHLANVAFHLNDRGAHDDARVLLEHARSLDGSHAAVHNNMAAARAGLGDPRMAIVEAMDAAAARPGESFFIERLAHYHELAGDTGAASALRALLADPTQDQTVPTPPLAAASPEAGLLLGQLATLSVSMLTALGPPPPSLPMSLDSTLDPEIVAALIGIRETALVCAQLVRDDNAHQPAYTVDYLICQQCEIPEKIKLSDLAGSLAARIVSEQMSYEAHATTVYSSHLVQGVDLVLAAGLSRPERDSLVAWWAAQVLQAKIDGMRVLADEVVTARAFVRDYANDIGQAWCLQAGAPPPVFLPAPCTMTFCGKFTVWLVVASLDVDLQGETMEIAVGQAAQAFVGWNFKADAPILGVGVGVNLDAIVRPGLSVKFLPGQGVVASAGFSLLPGLPGAPNVSPPIAPPGLDTPIAKYAVFMN